MSCRFTCLRSPSYCSGSCLYCGLCMLRPIHRSFRPPSLCPSFLSSNDIIIHQSSRHLYRFQRSTHHFTRCPSLIWNKDTQIVVHHSCCQQLLISIIHIDKCLGQTFRSLANVAQVKIMLAIVRLSSFRLIRHGSCCLRAVYFSTALCRITHPVYGFADGSRYTSLLTISCQAQVCIYYDNRIVARIVSDVTNRILSALSAKCSHVATMGIYVGAFVGEQGSCCRSVDVDLAQLVHVRHENRAWTPP